MTPGRFQLLDELLATVSELPVAERDAWFARKSLDPDLRTELKSLLSTLESETDTIGQQLRNAAADVAQDLSSDPLATGRLGADPMIGENCGAWRIQKLLGQGGMGAVYLGVREGDEYHQQAAIKLLRLGPAAGEYALTQFRRERRILSRLEHPNITRLIDGGAYLTPSGARLPYLAMEFVDGEPLIAYADRNKLSVPARIALFRKICQAVQFAHERLIVHRDLKPGNILVTPEGEPKLLDFGIARLVDPATAPIDETVTRIFTPDYASPEQIRGESPLPASDVFSLGTILYELLAGERPFDRQSLLGMKEGEKNASEKEAAAPSSRKGPLAAKLAGDLDNIILMAVRLDPARRYRSAERLDDDLRRYLNQLPVAARSDTVAYRLGKFVLRNRVILIAAAAVVLATALGFTAQQQQARIARQRFQQVRNLSHRFIFDFNDQIRVLPGSTAVREMMVNTALEYLDNLSRDGHGDTGLQWELAKAYEKVGDVQGSPLEPSLGHTADALKSYLKAAAMQEDLAAQGVLNADQRESLAHTYAQIVGIYRVTSRPADAVRAAERGVFHARLASPFAEGRALSHLGLALMDAGEPKKAFETEQAALKQTLRAATEQPVWSRQSNVAALYLATGRAKVRMGDFEGAIPFLHHAIDLREGRLAEPTLDTVNARELVLAYHAMGDTLGGTDRFSLQRTAEAVVWYRKALALAQQMSAGDAKNASARMEVARSSGKLGAALQNDDPAEAIRLFGQALHLAEALLPEGVARDGLRAAAYRSLAVPLVHLGRRQEGLGKLRVALNVDEANLARRPGLRSAMSDLAEDWRILGSIEGSIGPANESAAMEDYRRSLEFADRSAALAPKDFSSAFPQIKALKAMLAAGKGEAQADARHRLVEIWTKWNQLQPGSPFIERQLAAIR